MEKQKRWQLFLIISVVVLTIYNILPTLFYYSKPLNRPITQTQAEEIAENAGQRVNSLEKQSLNWLNSFTKLLAIKPLSISFDEASSQFINIEFKNAEDAQLFKTYLPRAGALISFAPAQLSLSQLDNDDPKKVTVIRKIPMHFEESAINSSFAFGEKWDKEGKTSSLYQNILNDRLAQLGMAIGGSSENAQLLNATLHTQDSARKEEFLITICQNISDYLQVFGENHPIAKKFFSSLTQGEFSDRNGAVEQFMAQLDSLKDAIRLERIELQEQAKALKETNDFLEVADQQRLEFLQKRESLVVKVADLVRNNHKLFASGSSPWTYQEIFNKIEKGALTSSTDLHALKVSSHNALLDALVIDVGTQLVQITLSPEVKKLQDLLGVDKLKTGAKEKLEQLIYNEIARVARESREEISPANDQFEIALSSLPNSPNFLTLNLNTVAESESAQVLSLITKHWHPKHEDLQRSSFPIWDYATYKKLPAKDKRLGLVVYTPSTLSEVAPQGIRTNSIYVVAKGLGQIVKKYEDNPNSPQAKAFLEDFNKLRTILANQGYYGYPGNTYPLSSNFSKDFIFESEDFYSSILSGMREDFKVYGTRKYAVLEFSNLKQRIYALNQIEDSMHEDLLKWRDEYQAAQVNPNASARYDVPKPTSSPLLDNFFLSFRKYFRGDERKILHWGLDLSGGKTVQIELRDQNNKKVTNSADLAQGINELYNRVNKMGLSEVGIRQDGANITLDFPGAQGLSAGELVKASSMYFHVVNEQFTPSNMTLGEHVNRFLQDVWNEAVVTNKKDVDSINRIAAKHLYGESLDPELIQPRSESAKMLYDHGLKLPLSTEDGISSNFSEIFSKIAIIRGSNFTEWFNQTHPLLIVFNNYALEGSSLMNVQASYDPTRGNFLSFEVKGSQINSDGLKFSPRADLFAWTSTYSKEKILGTPAEKISQGNGWRMAVILNGTVISAPRLDSALRDRAMITGSFTQREINKLESDLKAGSLTYSPVILAEKNISPELGVKERFQGILATVVALVLVVAAMVSYYRFAGTVASAALLFNLLIMWAVLQNIQATLTLAGIAGIILAMGMAVDANVLVFERFREEFKATGRLAFAMQAAYKKAFSAIIDSNLTTIIAGLILLHFDSGPIKGFAITIIIGIVSSMFTALFMTKYFFASWMRNPKHKTLSMASWIKPTQFNFLRFGKLAMIMSIVLTLVGGASAVLTRHSIFGMDFTGGFSLSLEVNPNQNANYRSQVEHALVAQGLTSHDFQVRELTPSNHLRIFLSKALEQPGKPFHGLPVATDNQVSYSYENNPRIVWVVNALQAEHLTLTPTCVDQLDSQWTNISGQMSSAMRNNALYGLALAFICILLYITVRFEFKYAVAATIGLAHDVLITIGTVCVLHALRVPLQLELNTIAALMAIIGYSLNDTIIIFDRIREDMKFLRKLPLKDVILHALNVTLSRTLMTSGTTILVLLALVVLGGPTLFGFSLVMTIGILYGTLSSLFIATPLLYYLHKREESKEHYLVETK